MSFLESRIAKEKDYSEIAELCRRAVGRDDYVLPILRKMISSGGVFIALDGSKIVGITNYQKTIDGGGWMSSARTDPDYRGRRVAGFLQESIASYARKQGVRFLRLWINKSNNASIKAAVRGGFRPLSEMIHLSRKVDRKSKRDRTLSRFENPSASDVYEILNSNYMKGMNGFFAHYWQLIRASENVIREVARRGDLYRSNQGGDVFFIPDEQEKWGGIQHNEFAPLDGPLKRSLKEIHSFAPLLGTDSLGSFLPYNQHHIRVARDLGYLPDAWGDHAVLFEKTI